jgi:predicted PP-loop superfamily ATPase
MTLQFEQTIVDYLRFRSKIISLAQTPHEVESVVVYSDAFELQMKRELDVRTFDLTGNDLSFTRKRIDHVKVQVAHSGCETWSKTQI